MYKMIAVGIVALIVGMLIGGVGILQTADTCFETTVRYACNWYK